MAKFNKGILGPIQGKIGPVIGSSWKGIPYLKALNPDKKERVPSAAQKMHHKKFAYLTRWLRPLHPYLSVGFKNLAKHKTEINASFSHNFQALRISDTNELYIDYAGIEISSGHLNGILETEMNMLNEHTLALSWKSQDTPLSAYNDQLMLVVYNDELGIADGFIGGIKRAAKQCRFEFDQRLAGKPVHVYVGLVSLNGKHISDSQYLGKIEHL